ncbi:hypothetical protein ACFQ6Q_05850 [Streptomyces sp. NPDC056437]|uniref:hypothetical protein n=1 Tax=Streptomyces sp. NPDC056437 TaxID=3345816 RepID=UPI00368D39B0
MPYHALEITLTRPATRAELARAAHVMALAPNRDRTRLITLAAGKTPAKALTRAHRHLAGLLPVDAVATHYPDADHRIRLLINFSPDDDALIRRAAKRAGQTTGTFIETAVRDALAHREREEAARLDRALQRLLTTTTPLALLAAIGRHLPHHTLGPTHAASH